MPIKEIVQYGFGIAMAIGLTGNPAHFKEHLRKVQFQILRECTRVDNWGNPSPFHHGSPEFKPLSNRHFIQKVKK